jgi:signal transduction histidine kinase
MNKAVPEFRVYPPETAFAHGDSHPSTGDKPARLENLTHELRQPLGVIESLAFYLELIAAEDDKSRLHLREPLASQTRFFIVRWSCSITLLRYLH